VVPPKSMTMAGLDVMPLECVGEATSSNIFVEQLGHMAFPPLPLTTMVDLTSTVAASSLQSLSVTGITGADVRCIQQGV